jgi:hypothetical protein
MESRGQADNHNKGLIGLLGYATKAYAFKTKG